MNLISRMLAGWVLVATGVAASGPAAAGSPTPPAARTVVLDIDSGSYRAYARWKTPTVFDKGGTLSPLPAPKRAGQTAEAREPMRVVAAAPPPADWTAPAFDDSRWARLRAPAVVPNGAWGYGLTGVPGGHGVGVYTGGNQLEWNLVCLRGRFQVDDPAQVQDLRLRLRYHGGAVVYVNGRELCRAYLPAGPLTPDTLAERYPDETYLRPDGQLYRRNDGKEFADRLALRVRELTPAAGADGVVIPPPFLTKGVNVIAIASCAAPVNDRMLALGFEDGLTPWPHAGVVEARLTAAAPAGLVPNVGPSDAIACWNSQPLETVELWDYAHPGETLKPIRLVGARNGWFSGKAVLGSQGSIRGLTARVSDLTQEGGAGATIPASAVQVRWAEPANPTVSWVLAYQDVRRFDRLLTAIPSDLLPVQASVPGRRPQPPASVVAPIWVTVHVAADAAPGEYGGTLTLSARTASGAPATFAVPIHLSVADWRLPDPNDFVTHHNFYQSPDTVAQFYKVPLWSEKHFELMGKSLDVLHQAGNKICAVPLVVKADHLQNSESMVRWVRKPDGGYDYDFTILEKYLDLYAARAGKPGILQLNLWAQPNRVPDPTLRPPYHVTVFDPATGQLSTMPQPAYGTAANEAFWRPVMTELRRRLEQRGWFDVTAVCFISYCYAPTKEMVAVYKRLWPDGKWMNTSHANPTSWPGTDGSMPVPYCEWVWGSGRLYNPELDRGGKGEYAFYPRPWKAGTARIEVTNPRAGSGVVNALRAASSLVVYRTVTEAALQANVRGLGRVGGDFWPLPIGPNGRPAPLCDGYGGVGMENNTLALTCPGPDGAVFSERLETFREGVQVAEAIIFVQRALDAGRLDAASAQRARDLLDERARYYLRARFPSEMCQWAFECSNWQERDRALFTLAAEIGKGR